MLGWGRQSEGGGWHFLPESLPLPHPYPNQQLSPSPAHPRWKSGRQRPEAPEGEKGKPTDGQAEPPPIRVWPAGRGGGCGAQTSDAISSQGTIKVTALPGGPGCLQRSLHPRRLLLPAWAARSGYAPMGSCCLVSRTPVSGSLLFTPCLPLSSLFFLPLSLSPSASVLCSFFFPFTVSHSLVFPPFNFLHSCSLYLFFSDAFLVSLIFFLSASLFLFLFHPLPSGSSRISLSTPKMQQLRDERILHDAPEKVGPAPLRASMEPFGAGLVKRVPRLDRTGVCLLHWWDGALALKG